MNEQNATVAVEADTHEQPELVDFDVMKNLDNLSIGANEESEPIRLKDHFELLFEDGQVSIYRGMVTPDLARRMLANNFGNRKASRGHITKLGRDMKLEKWQFNGQAILYNDVESQYGERLLDGQNRLIAAFGTDSSFPTLIISNLPPEVFQTIDELKPRSGADTLSTFQYVSCRNAEEFLAAQEANPIKNSNEINAALTIIHRIKTGQIEDNRHKLTNTERLEVIGKYGIDNLLASSQAVGKLGRHLMSRSILTALHFLFKEKDSEAADKFMEDYRLGAGLEETDGVLQLRNRISQLESAKGVNVRQVLKLALAIKAWNARRAGRPVTRLIWTAKEAFPEII